MVSRFEREYSEHIDLLYYIHPNLMHNVIMYTIEPPMKFLDWIDEKKINWNFLSANPSAVDLIKTAMEEQPEIIYRHYMASNTDATEILKDHIFKLDWRRLSANPAAIDMILEHPEKIDWNFLSGNPNPRVIDLLKKHPEKINWNWLSANPAAIDLIKTTLKERPEKINWQYLSMNSAAIDLLKKHPEKINWSWLSENSSIFEIDYGTINKTVRKNIKN